jgi:hypothetical protein
VLIPYSAVFSTNINPIPENVSLQDSIAVFIQIISPNVLSKDTGPGLEGLQKLYDMRSHVPAKLHDLGGVYMDGKSHSITRIKLGI